MAKGKGLTIGKIRGGLYKGGKILGDINAVVRGTIVLRIMRRILGSLASRGISTVLGGKRRP
ncbi:MAG: hypothetical protein Q8K18_12350 [Burkholderiales bacterium]|nr:hypothetical protein [Burkholderiales bacterium]